MLKITTLCRQRARTRALHGFSAEARKWVTQRLLEAAEKFGVPIWTLFWGGKGHFRELVAARYWLVRQLREGLSQRRIWTRAEQTAGIPLVVLASDNRPNDRPISTTTLGALLAMDHSSLLKSRIDTTEEAACEPSAAIEST